MEKKALGKGLGALIPSAAQSSMPIQGSGIRVDQIVFNPYQPRISNLDDDKFKELVDSVKVHGVLQPILVRTKGPNEYELVAGERRLRAARAVGLEKIPAVVRELTNEQSLQIALIENLQREDINSIDAAIAYKRLSTEFGLSQEEIAFSLGKSRSAVTNTMRLLTLPEVIQNKLKRNMISEGHARAILALNTEDLQIELGRKIVDGGLSVREAERMAKEWNRIENEGGKLKNVSRETLAAREDPNILQIESRLREQYGTKVSVVRNKDRGRIEIEFYSDDDFDRLLNLLVGF